MVKMEGKYFAGAIIIELLAISLLFGQLAYAEGLGDTLKQTAVKAVGIVSSSYSQKLNNTNVTKTVKSTVGGVVTKFAGRQAGTIVANGAWSNALTPAGAKTAAKIILATGAGITASQAPVRQILAPVVNKKNVPKAVGDKVWKTNFANVYRSISSQADAYSKGKVPSGVPANRTNATYGNGTSASVNIKK